MPEQVAAAATTQNSGDQRTPEQIAAEAAKTPEQIEAEKNAGKTPEQIEAEKNAGKTPEQIEAERLEAEKAAQDGAPEKYELKPQEGQAFSPKFLEVYTEVARELNLSQEKAQLIIDKVGPVIEQEQMAKLEEVREKWTQDSTADKEFGGAKFDENLGVAKVALDTFGTQALKDLLNASGIGNHPEVIRYSYRVGKAITPDGFVGGRQEGSGGKSFNDIANRLYPSAK